MRRIALAALCAAFAAACGGTSNNNPPTPHPDGGHPDAGGCIADTDCPAGKVCRSGACITPTYTCSATNTTGTCPTGQQCLSGVCRGACSSSEPQGYCTNANEQCVSGACVGPCGPGAPNGWCANAGDVCYDSGSGAVCTPPGQIPCGTSGGTLCPANQTCTGTPAACADNCDSAHPNGYCASGACYNGACVTPGAPAAGDLFVDEILVNGPNDASNNEPSEYFEMYVAGAQPFDLNGCVITSASAGESFTIAGSTVVNPGDYVTFAKSGDAALMGFTPRVAYQNVNFTNSATSTDFVAVACGGTEVDRFAWGQGSGFTMSANVALELAPSHLNAAGAHVAANWGNATATFTQTLPNGAVTVNGTPGAANSYVAPCGPNDPSGNCVNSTDKCMPDGAGGYACTGACSPTNVLGWCPNAGEVCSSSGVCPCSAQTPAGYCATAGQLCYDPGTGPACTDPAQVPCANGGTLCTNANEVCDPATATCVQTCQSGGTYCPPPDICAVDPATSTNNCFPPNQIPCASGGTACPANQTCVSSACVDDCSASFPSGYCASPQVCDGTACVNPCGVNAGTWCASPQVCDGAACQTPCGVSGGTWCPTAGDVCYDPGTGPACTAGNTVPCASGGTLCGASQTCVNAVCLDDCSTSFPTGYCASPQVCDGTQCTNPCGVSGGTWCAAPQVCDGTTCQTPCGSGGTWCPNAGDLCYDPGTGLACTPPANVPCASGGTMCAANQTCVNSACVDDCGFNGGTWCPLATQSCCTNYCGSQVVMSQLYGAGGNTGAVYNHDYVELHNRSGAAIDISGWAIQYASATGTTTWQVTSAFPANTLIQPGEYLLVQLASGANGAALPAPDLTPATVVNLAGASGKVALTNNATQLSGQCPTSGAIMDLVGYGTANCSWVGNAPAMSATLALFRGDAGCANTNTNSADFTTGAPAPRNSATSVYACPCTP